MEYVRFSDYGIHKDDIIFVDTVEGMDKVKDGLINSKILGMDSEFTGSFTKFDP